MYNLHYSVLGDLYGDFKIFETMESRKLRGKLEDPFGIKRGFFI